MSDAKLDVPSNDSINLWQEFISESNLVVNNYLLDSKSDIHALYTFNNAHYRLLFEAQRPNSEITIKKLGEKKHEFRCHGRQTRIQHSHRRKQLLSLVPTNPNIWLVIKYC